MLKVLSAAEILIVTGIFVWLGLRSFKGWKKIREEFLLHITIFYFLFGFICLFILALAIPSDFNVTAISNEMKVMLDFCYNLFYLQFSLFYLSIFSNSRSHFESYSPVIIAFSTFLTLGAGFSGIERYFEVSSLFHFISLFIAILLIYLGLKHINQGKKYVHNDEELGVLNFLTKILNIAPILLIFDLVGFIYLIYNPGFVLQIDETFFFLFSTMALIFVLIAYYYINLFSKKLEKIDILSLLNTIS